MQNSTGKIFTLFLIIILYSSCFRGGDLIPPPAKKLHFPTEKPVLDIIVTDWHPVLGNDALINRCIVKIYKSEQDLVQNGPAIATGVTSVWGTVRFQLDSSTYWVRCIRECMTNKGFIDRTSLPISRYHLNREFISIAQYTKLNIKNTTPINYNFYAVYGNDYLLLEDLAANHELKTVIRASPDSLVLEAIDNPAIRKTYQVNLECVDSTNLEVL